MLERLDTAVLIRVEAWCHRFQRLTGRTNFTLARAAHVGAVLSVVLAGLLGPQSHDARFVSGAIGSMAWMYGSILWGIYRRVEEHYRYIPRVAHPNTLLWRSMVLQRCLAALIVVATIGYWLSRLPGPAQNPLWYIAAGWCWLAAQYLQCVIPLPSCGSKIRELIISWWNSLVSTPVSSAA